uniref:Uncharacterized conserved protein n=1 Tax=uncultured crenarchaeote 57a5 TaxID=684058 RepID=D4N723_9CREN|nr:uncharacterized conserved protein [uncultured crenarchaeote 57a5]
MLLHENSNKVPDKNNFGNKRICALCGRIIGNNKTLEETIDGDRFPFDSHNCVTIFKKLANLYGHEFKSISIEEQYIYNPNWEIIVPKEHEFGLKNDIGADQNETFQVIRDPIQVQDLVFKLVGSSKNEILGIFSTVNAFHRQESVGMIPKLQQVKDKNNKLRINILTPFDDQIALISQKLKKEFGIEIMNLEESSRIRASILLVDRKFVIYTELKDDTKKTSYEAIGVSFLSTIKSTVISFVTIFEIMWRQQGLYQQISNFEHQIEKYKQENRKLNEIIDNFKK